MSSTPATPTSSLGSPSSAVLPALKTVEMQPKLRSKPISMETSLLRIESLQVVKLPCQAANEKDPFYEIGLFYRRHEGSIVTVKSAPLRESNESPDVRTVRRASEMGKLRDKIHLCIKPLPRGDPCEFCAQLTDFLSYGSVRPSLFAHALKTPAQDASPLFTAFLQRVLGDYQERLQSGGRVTCRVGSHETGWWPPELLLAVDQFSILAFLNKLSMSQASPLLPALKGEASLKPSFRNPAARIACELRRIDHVEIPCVMKSAAGSFYTIHIYFKTSTSNIPTTTRIVKISNVWRPTSRAPDAIIYHRFSDISALRYDLQYEASSPVKQCKCTQCRRMSDAFQHGLRVPHFHAKWFRDAERVCQDLEDLLNPLVQAVVPPVSTNRLLCESTQQSQSQLHRFLFEPENGDTSTAFRRDRRRKAPSARAPCSLLVI